MIPRYLRLIFLLFCLNIATTNLTAQDQDADTSGSNALIGKGVKLHDQGKYREALDCYSQVSKCDPNYKWALFESALSLNESDRRSEALKKIDEALSLHYEIPQIYALKGSILDQEGKTREGAAIIDSALMIWPYNQNLLFNLAVCLVNMTEYEQAEKILLKSLRINPYHAGSNMALAKVNLFMGRNAQAYLAFNMAILLNPGISAMNQFEKAIFGKYDTLIHSYKYSYRNNPDSAKWKELTMLLQSGFPYQENFEYPYKPDYKIFRMSLLVFRSLKFDSNDTSLYNQFYARFFVEMMDEFGFEMYLNYCLKNLENAGVDEWLAKNKEKYEKFVKWAQTSINSRKSYGFSYIDEIAGIPEYHYNNKGSLEAIGSFPSQRGSKQGEWITLDGNGCVKDRGSYVNDKKTGNWTIYWPDAKVKQRLNYTNDSLDGTCSTWYQNGAKNGQYYFKAGKQEGREEHFRASGEMSRFVTYSRDSAEGPAMLINYEEWFKREYTNKAGEVDGMVTETWLNGVKKFTGNYKNGIREGIHRFWYSNDTLESVENYANDTLRGPFISYYRNGKVWREGRYDSQGRMQGIVRTFYPGGKIETVDSAYTDGLLCGTRTEYYNSGIVKEVLKFDKDLAVGMKAYDSSGNRIWQAEPVNGTFRYKGFYPDGRLMTEGDYVNGKHNGEWISYTPAGIKIKSSNYINDELTGAQQTNYKTGKPKERFNSDSSRIIGRYIEYFSRGNIKSKGDYKFSGASGEWFYYYPDDSVETRSFLIDGHPAGCTINYSISNNPETEVFYEDDGSEIRTLFFDRLGKMTSDWDYHYGESKYVERYPGGVLHRVIHTRDNLKTGNSELYYPNGKMWQQVPYCYGKVEGTIKTWDPKGNLVNEMPFDMGERNGLRKDYTDGKLNSVSMMENNDLNGTETDYYENGKISRVIEWADDTREGKSDYFAPDGSFMYRIIYWADVIAGYTCCGPDGKLLPVKPVTSETTEISTSYADGKPSMKAGLKSGCYHGKFTSWYPGGNVMKEATYVDDDEEGLFKVWFQGNILKESITYKNGYRNGKYSLYYPGGSLRLKGSYYYDEEDGEWELYNENGKHTATYIYNSGKLYEIRTF
ncbi:MAG: hypothetical protein NTU51_04360 [Bacteroidetes bacterium]|nr:hypothetical protein [Bacteroidota bacterium]